MTEQEIGIVRGSVANVEDGEIFLDEEPEVCPCCSSESIHWGTNEFSTDAVRRRVHCGACEASWESIFKCTSIFIVTDGKPLVNPEKENV